VVAVMASVELTSPRGRRDASTLIVSRTHVRHSNTLLRQALRLTVSRICRIPCIARARDYALTGMSTRNYYSRQQPDRSKASRCRASRRGREIAEYGAGVNAHIRLRFRHCGRSVARGNSRLHARRASRCNVVPLARVIVGERRRRQQWWSARGSGSRGARRLAGIRLISGVGRTVAAVSVGCAWSSRR